jgi:phosphopantothenoylcysteine decarboxylase/phosphopantothenate--cysteine ligase
VIKAAAVSDYTVPHPPQHKMKRKGAISLELEATADILADIASRKRSQIVIGFAAETHDVIANGRHKLASKSLDAIVVNDVSKEGVGFDAERNAVTILTAGETIEVPETSKWEVAERVLDCAVKLKQSAKLNAQKI